MSRHTHKHHLLFILIVLSAIVAGLIASHPSAMQSKAELIIAVVLMIIGVTQLVV